MNFCQRDQIASGKGHPRSCAECGLGPCKKYRQDEYPDGYWAGFPDGLKKKEHERVQPPKDNPNYESNYSDEIFPSYSDSALVRAYRESIIRETKLEAEVAQLREFRWEVNKELAGLRMKIATGARAEPLFQTGNFTLHSGAMSNWKIECDALTEEDWKTLAVMIVERCGPFSSVVGVPRGGLPLAEALKPHVSATGPRLVVDDVLTTGNSILELTKFDFTPSIGWVVFARGRCPHGVRALFQMEPTR